MGHNFKETASRSTNTEKFNKGFDAIDWGASKRKVTEDVTLVDSEGEPFHGWGGPLPVTITNLKHEMYQYLKTLENLPRAMELVRRYEGEE